MTSCPTRSVTDSSWVCRGVGVRGVFTLLVFTFPPITMLHRPSTCRCLYFGTSITSLYFQCGYLVAYGAYTYSVFAPHLHCIYAYTYAHHHINIKFYVTAAKESQKLHRVHGTTLQNGLSNSIQQRRSAFVKE